MTTAPLRVAILGSGPRGLVNAELLQSTGLGTVVGFWDRTPERAAAAADRFGSRSAVSARELVEDTAPDLVAILTHPAARSELVAAAVAGGARAILIEKPLALSSDELSRVEEAAGDAFVVVNTQYQWMPHWRDYLARIRAGALGDIRSIEGSCGVAAIEQGPHVLGLCLAIADAAGLPSAQWVLAGGSDSELIATFGLGDVRLIFAAGGAAAPVPGETIIHFQQQERATGTGGRLWVSLNRGAEFVTEPSGAAAGRDTTEWPRDDTLAQSAFYRDLGGAIADPKLRDAFPTRLTVAARETRLLFAALESARIGTRVSLA